MADPEKTLVVVERALEDEDRIRKLMEVMPDGMDPKRFIRATLTAIARNEELLKCTPASIILAVFDAAEAGFVPTGAMSRAWLVPYSVNVAKRGQPRKYEHHARLTIGYQGLADLMREGGATKVESRPVFEGDGFQVTYGTDPHIWHAPRFETVTPDQMTHVYAVATLLGGDTTIFEVMTKQDVDHVRASGAANSPAWIQHYVQMARKTVIRRLANYMHLSDRAQAVIAKDDLVTIAPTEPADNGRTAEVRAKLAEKLGKAPPPPEAETETPEEPEIDIPEEEDQDALYEELNLELDAAEAARGA